MKNVNGWVGENGVVYDTWRERREAEVQWKQQEKQNQLLEEQNRLLRRESSTSNYSSGHNYEAGPFTIGDAISVTLFFSIVLYVLAFMGFFDEGFQAIFGGIFGIKIEGWTVSGKALVGFDAKVGMIIATIGTVLIALKCTIRLMRNKK